MVRTEAPPPRTDSLPWSPVEALGVFVDLLVQVESAPAEQSDFYDRLCEATARLAHLSRAVIFVWDEARQRVRAVGSKDVPLETFAGSRVSPANVPIARAALAGDRVVEAYDNFEERGKRRLHKTPKRFEIDACRPWLDAELQSIDPEALVVLGATAGKALLGSGFKITQMRGRVLESDLAPIVAATIHPSAILRQRDDESRHAERLAFTRDLEQIASVLNARS